MQGSATATPNDLDSYLPSTLRKEWASKPGGKEGCSAWIGRLSPEEQARLHQTGTLEGGRTATEARQGGRPVEGEGGEKRGAPSPPSLMSPPPVAPSTTLGPYATPIPSTERRGEWSGAGGLRKTRSTSEDERGGEGGKRGAPSAGGDGGGRAGLPRPSTAPHAVVLPRAGPHGAADRSTASFLAQLGAGGAYGARAARHEKGGGGVGAVPSLDEGAAPRTPSEGDSPQDTGDTLSDRAAFSPPHDGQPPVFRDTDV